MGPRLRPVSLEAAYPLYTASGHLLFVREHTVFAVELDLESDETRGLPVPVVDGIETSVGDQEGDNGSAQFDVSADGILVYRTIVSSSRATRVAAFDFESETLTPFGDEGFHLRPTLSPDGRWLAVGRGPGEDAELYLFDTSTRIERRFTRRAGIDRPGCWSVDSQEFYWSSTSGGDGLWWVLRQPIDGSAPPDSLISSSDTLLPTSISPDGGQLYLDHWMGADSWDIVRVDLQRPDSELETVVGGPIMEVGPRLSPDGRWIAYSSDESGDLQLYLRRVPDTGAVWQLTRGNQVWYGFYWTSDGRGILVRSGQGLHRIDTELSEGVVQISPLRLMVAESFHRTDAGPALAPFRDDSGAYVLVGENGGIHSPSEVVVVSEWFPQLQALVASAR